MDIILKIINVKKKIKAVNYNYRVNVKNVKKILFWMQLMNVMPKLKIVKFKLIKNVKFVMMIFYQMIMVNVFKKLKIVKDKWSQMFVQNVKRVIYSLIINV